MLLLAYPGPSAAVENQLLAGLYSASVPCTLHQTRPIVLTDTICQNSGSWHDLQTKCLIWGGLWDSFGKRVPSKENQPAVRYWSLAQLVAVASTMEAQLHWGELKHSIENRAVCYWTLVAGSTLDAQILSSTNPSPTTAEIQKRGLHKKVQHVDFFLKSVQLTQLLRGAFKSNFWKNLGFRPNWGGGVDLVGPNSQIFPKIRFEGSP